MDFCYIVGEGTSSLCCAWKYTILREGSVSSQTRF